MRLIYLIIGGACLVSFSQPVHADSFFAKLFGASDNQVTVDENGVLRAPFSQPSKEEAAAPRPFLNAIPLDQPHRDHKALSKWLTVVVSEALTFKTPDFKSELMKRSAYFDKPGGAQFLEFLRSKNLYDVHGTHNLFMHSVVSNDPVLLNEGAVKDRYRWLYDVPVMVTYTRPEHKTYEDMPSIDGNNTKEMTVRVQIGRLNEDWTWDGLAIESWEVRDNR